MELALGARLAIRGRAAKGMLGQDRVDRRGAGRAHQLGVQVGAGQRAEPADDAEAPCRRAGRKARAAHRASPASGSRRGSSLDTGPGSLASATSTDRRAPRFPLRDHGGGHAVADHVGHGASHVEDLVDRQHQRHARGGQMEQRRDRGDHHHRAARHAGHALAAQHQDQQHQHLLRDRHVDAESLGDEDRGEGLVHHRAVEVEGVAERQREAHHLLRHAETFELLGQARIGGLAAGRREGQHGRLAHRLQQAADVAPQEQPADAPTSSSHNTTSAT